MVSASWNFILCQENDCFLFFVFFCFVLFCFFVFFLQISTHSRLLSDRDIPLIAEAADLPEGCVKCVTLQQFQTEQQFCDCIG